MNRLLPGAAVVWNSKDHVLLDIRGLTHALIRPFEGGRSREVPLVELYPSGVKPADRNLHEIDEQSFTKATSVFEALRPLLEKPRYKRSVAEVDAVARALGKCRDSVYRYLAKWERTQRVSTFVRKERADKGRTRLAPEVVSVANELIKQHYARGEQPSVASTVEQIETECLLKGLRAPSYSTIKRLLGRQDQRELKKGREGSKAARERFEPLRGSFPGADHPLDVLQIDHTPMDVILVDEEHREPIGRCYLTLVLDVCTRVIAGFCVTLEHPGALSAALALAHAMLPKDEWLAERNIKAAWPIFGKPQKVHADNAKEFRGTAITRGCAEHGIILENRPKGLPQYGGAIERAVRTFMQKAHELPGTTFSNVVQKADYDSEGKARLTLRECEQWLALFILYRYHNKKHKTTGYPPINLYKKHVCGDDKTPGVGLPPLIADGKRLRLDFFPYFEATVQNYGIQFKYIWYWEDCLRRWIHAVDRDNPKAKRKFVVAYDPRDISTMYFYDPETREYLEVPYHQKSRPPISVWELNAALRRINEDPASKPNEEAIFEGILHMRALVDDATHKTKKARRMAERKKAWDRDSLPSKDRVRKAERLVPVAAVAPAPAEAARDPSKEVIESEDDSEEIQPYDLEDF